MAVLIILLFNPSMVGIFIRTLTIHSSNKRSTRVVGLKLMLFVRFSNSSENSIHSKTNSLSWNVKNLQIESQIHFDFPRNPYPSDTNFLFISNSRDAGILNDFVVLDLVITPSLPFLFP